MDEWWTAWRESCSCFLWGIVRGEQGGGGTSSDIHAMLQDILTRFPSLVIGIDLYHNLVEILDHILDLICGAHQLLPLSTPWKETYLQQPLSRFSRKAPYFVLLSSSLICCLQLHAVQKVAEEAQMFLEGCDLQVWLVLAWLEMTQMGPGPAPFSS